MFKNESAVAFLSGLVEGPEYVKVSPKAILQSRVAYQNWNLALAMTYIIKILCVVTAAYVDPDAMLHGWWIMGASLAGMFFASKLSLDILVTQRGVDKRLGEINPKATGGWLFERRDTLDRITAATLIDATVFNAAMAVMVVGGRAARDTAAVELGIPAVAIMAVILTTATLAAYFIRRPAERRLLIGM
jgi:hypothetical protein